MGEKSYLINVLSIAHRIYGQSTEDLLTRQLAKEIKAETDQIIHIMHTKEAFRIFQFDFKGVKHTDHSFIQELVVNTQVDFLKKTDLLLYCVGMNAVVKEMLYAAVITYNHQLHNRKVGQGKRDREPVKVLVLANCSGKLQYVGDLEDTLAMTYEYIAEHGKLTARELAGYEGVTINNASLWLKRLYNLRLVLRDEDEDFDAGRQHMYWLP